ncbi:MAG: type VI secretion system membrane subunit TssM [Pseudomonadota bacterium]
MIYHRVIRPLFRSSIGILILTLLILAPCIWFFGPMVGWGEFYPLDSVTSRIVTIAVLTVLTLLIVGLILWRRRSRETRMAENIAGEGTVAEDPRDAAVKSELGEIQGRMKEALGFLRKAKLGGKGGKSLYQLPWYIIIGPPGAGKTTAIVNSGLRFPLAERMGKTALGGIGGTRNCDWWFTDDAVLIDTAGRYTTQESDAEADSAAWTGFLEMLKKNRSRQPINGALIAISLSDLSLQDEITRKSHARAVRRRLSELREKLGVRFPIYLLFTKADLIAGFAEFFEPLGKEEREQVWGVTFPHQKAGPTPLESFGNEFDALLSQLNNRSLERMQQETDYQRRSLVAGFPNQVASLRPVADEFLREVFQANRYEEAPFLRGVYFTSGTQEGTPIDRLMMGMARSFGIGRQAIGTGQGSGRSFFLTRLLQGVMFREAGLVSADDRVERRYRWVLRGAAAAAVLAVLGAGTLWTVSYLGNKEMIAETGVKVEQYQALAARIPGNPVADADIPAVVAPLNILRDLPGNPVQGDPEPPTELTWGLYQGGAVGTEAAQTYRGALNQLLLPRLLVRLEEQMQSNLNNPELLYEALKIYLMLGLQGPMDAELVRQWMLIDWRLAYGGQDEMVGDLTGHLDALMAQPMQEIALNGPMVEQIQAILSETPLAERIYNGIVKSPQARAVPEFRLTEAGGPATARVLARPSGKTLSEGVEGIFTHDGFNDVFLPEALTVATRIQKESWVLGPRGEAEQTPGNLARLSRDVLNLYYNDYVGRYDALLGDLDIVPMESLSHAVDVTNVLSGPTSPIANILEAVAEETKLTQPKGGEVDVDGVADAASGFAASEALSALDARTQALVEALQSAAPAGGAAAEVEKPGTYVENRFAWLHELVSREAGASQLDDLVATMTEVYRELNRMSLGQGAGASVLSAAGGDGGAAARLQQATGRLPGPMQRWAGPVAAGASGITAGGARATLNAQWQSRILPFCQKAIEGRYPFERGAPADVALQDFSRLFAPNGLIDSFFNENLLTFVDTSATPWQWRRVNNTDLGISAAVLAQLQRAAEIRDSFFLAPGLPSVTFDLTPVALDPQATQVIVEVEGQELTYAHGPPQVTPFTWPGQAGGRTRVSFLPEQAGIENAVRRDGPWAWFRLLDAAEIRRTNVSDRSRVVFNIGGRISVFQLRAGSALNPFALPALRSFRCPRSL